MKLIQFFLCLFFIAANLQAQIPENEKLYNDETAQVSTSLEKVKIDSICTYKNDGCWIVNTTEKRTYTNGNLTGIKTFNTSLQPISYDSIIYNAEGLISTKIRFSNLTTTPHSVSYFYEYDTNKAQILEVMIDTTSINNIQIRRDSIHYENGLKMSRQITYYQNGVNYNTYYYYWQYDSGNKPIQMEAGYVYNNVNSPSSLEKYYYTNNNLDSTIIDTWNSSLVKWENYSKYTYQYDLKNNLIKKEYYYLVNLKWKIVNIEEYGYDSFARLSKFIFSKPFENDQNIVPVYQEIYLMEKNSQTIETNRYYNTLYGWKHYTKQINFYNQPQSLNTNWYDLCNNGKLELTLAVIGCPESVNDKLSIDPNISIFPNPNKGSFNILLKNKTAENYKINCYSPSGKLIKSVLIKGSGNKNTIPLNLNPNKGLFYIQVISGNNIYTEKILIQP
jgi:hypothetical protein